MSELWAELDLDFAVDVRNSADRLRTRSGSCEDWYDYLYKENPKIYMVRKREMFRGSRFT